MTEIRVILFLKWRWWIINNSTLISPIPPRSLLEVRWTISVWSLCCGWEWHHHCIQCTSIVFGIQGREWRLRPQLRFGLWEACWFKSELCVSSCSRWKREMDYDCSHIYEGFSTILPLWQVFVRLVKWAWDNKFTTCVSHHCLRGLRYICCQQVFYDTIW